MSCKIERLLVSFHRLGWVRLGLFHLLKIVLIGCLGLFLFSVFLPDLPLEEDALRQGAGGDSEPGGRGQSP